MSENTVSKNGQTKVGSQALTPKNNSKIDAARASFQQGNKLQKQGKLKQAISCYEEASKIRPRFAKPLLQLAEIHKARKNFAAAAKCYRQVIGINPNNHVSYIRLARTLKKQNKLYGAIAAFAEAMELKSDLSFNVYQEYADLLLQDRQDKSAALAAYRQAAAKKDDLGADFYDRFANLLAEENQLTEAIALYQKAIQINPDNANFHFALGECYLKQQQEKAAVNSFRQAIELNSEYAAAYEQLGNILKRRDRLEDAAKCYQKTLLIKPKKAVYSSLGDVLIAQGKQREAQQCYAQAI